MATGAVRVQVIVTAAVVALLPGSAWTAGAQANAQATNAQVAGVAVAGGRVFAAVGSGTENGGVSGMRGHLYALRASNGRLAWSFAGTAGPGQPGHSTWKGSSWQLGGADVWIAPSYDAKLGLPVHEVRVPQLAAQATSSTQPIPAGQSLTPTCPQRTGRERRCGPGRPERESGPRR
jgi:glucose dehydrogenase